MSMMTLCRCAGVPTYTYEKCVPYPGYRGVSSAARVAAEGSYKWGVIGEE